MEIINYIEIFVLGLVQGIAEFLPISSSAHLIIVRDIFGVGATLFAENSLLNESFDIALHFGTLIAIFVYFFKDFWDMIVNGILMIFKKNKMSEEKQEKGKMLWLVATATIPAAIFGVLLDEKVESFVRDKFVLIALALAIMGVIIKFCDKLNKTSRKLSDLTFRDALFIGLAQVCALIPGFSRSGTTISMARCLKINRSDAAKFSFYLSCPVVLGAVVLKVLKGEMISLITYNTVAFIMGVLVSFVVGLLCIKFLLTYIKKHDYGMFMWYRLLMSIAVLLTLLLK